MKGFSDERFSFLGVSGGKKICKRPDKSILLLARAKHQCTSVPENNNVMAQQQLMLLVSAALIIGAAIVTGMNRFTEQAASAEKDQILLTVVNVATRAQAWYHTPAALGGGGKSFDGFSFEKIHFKPNDGLGTVTLVYSMPMSMRVTGTVHTDTDWSIVVEVYPDSFDVSY